MKIERIEQLSHTDKLKLHFSDGTALRVPLTVVYDLGLKADQELSDEELEHIRDEAGYVSSKQRAVRILAASGSSRKELRRKLIQKGETQEHTDRTMEWLDSMDLLDDEAAAKQIAERAASRGYGPSRIRQILFQKGIDKKYWDTAMRGFDHYDDAIDKYLSGHLSSSHPDAKEKKKLTDALLRKGYSWEQIRRGFERQKITPEEELY